LGVVRWSMPLFRRRVRGSYVRDECGLPGTISRDLRWTFRIGIPS
jgi:hypothetical protein